MPQITFLPGNIVCEVDAGTSLQDAAEKAGVTLSFPCAGKGACGKCLVKVESGALDFDDNGKLSDELKRQGYVLACRSRAGADDVEILVTSSLSDEQGQFADALNRMGVEEALFPKKEGISPLVRMERMTVDAPVALDGLGDYDRFVQAVRAKLSLERVDLPLQLLQQLPDVLRDRDGEVCVWHLIQDDVVRIVDVAAGDPGAEFGLAVDIGTTTVAIQLVDMAEGRVIDTITQYNAQIDRGADVISRISYAKNPERIREMRTLVLGTINQGIATLCERNGHIARRSVRNVVISANTTMVQLFMGIKPDYIRLEPYTPAVMGVPFYRAEALGLDVNPQTFVWIAPNVGSYVGGDITAGLLCTDFAVDTEEICLFIDIGTNGEIVLGNGEFLMSCACSAGPAFEGGGIERGMRASKGAIDHVDIDPATGLAKYAVIGGGVAQGICGSGLISVLAQLFEQGMLDPRGKLDRSGKYTSVTVEGKVARYYIAPAKNGDPGVYLTENDIENFIRAKAAIFSACVTMLNSVELEFDSIGKFYIAGGFGRYIEIPKAQTLGLLPNLDEDCFLYVGNSSLTGSFMALLSEKHRAKVLELANKITYIDLSTEAGYMDEYVAAMFLPHTNMKLFAR
jgi:Uncharacterized metal-binding protein